MENFSQLNLFLVQVKTMRALQYFPTIEDPNIRRALFEVWLLLVFIFAKFSFSLVLLIFSSLFDRFSNVF